MPIKKKGFSQFLDFNADFNKLAAPLVGEILQTESEGPIGYVNARPIDRDNSSWRPNAQLVQKEENPPPGHERALDMTGLGEYERVVLSVLAWGQYSTYVLVGEMGSGKTATTKQILARIGMTRGDVCGKCAQCLPKVVYLNFNEGFNQDSASEVLANFKLRLYESLRKEMREFFSQNGLVDRFLETIAKSRATQVFDAFDGFAQYREEDPHWSTHTERVKTNKLFAFLESSVREPGARLERVMALVRFVREYFLPGPACFVLIFDNMDSVLPEAQYFLLKEIFALQDISKTKSLVVLRHSTFQKLNGVAAYSFGVISHRGPGVLAILQRRLEYYQNTWDTTPFAKALSKEHSAAARKRLRYLMATFEDPHSPVERAASLVGASARLGLYTMERAFQNVGIPFDQDPQNKDELFKAILVGASSAGELETADGSYANIFLDLDENSLSLLPCRIIQTLAALHRQESRRKLGNIYEMLVNMDSNWEQEKFRKTLNYLLLVRRPLVWVDGRSRYEGIDKKDADDILYLTEAGRHYFERGLKDLVYVQECLTSLYWPTEGDYLPEEIDYNLVIDRFRVLRGLLRTVKDQDAQQIAKLDEWSNSDNRRFYSREVGLLLVPILDGVGRSALNILRPSGADQHNAREELRDWLSLVIDVVNIEASRSRSMRNVKRDSAPPLERLMHQLQATVEVDGPLMSSSD